MDVSIIIPIYNAGKTIHISLDSIINNQPAIEFEVLCINDGSTDNTLDVLNDYALKYDFITVYTKENGGAACARNFALEKAKGEYIFYMDADDYIEGNMYEEMYTYAVENNLDIVMSDYYDTFGNIVKTKIDDNVLITTENKNKYFLTANTDVIIPFTWRNGYRKAFIKEHNIKHCPTLKYCDDSLFNTECFIYAKRIQKIGTSYYHYIFNSTGLQGGPKKDWLFNLEQLYEGKMNTYNKLKVDDYKQDLYIYTLTHTIGLLFSELVRTPNDVLREQINEINHSKMIEESFENVRIKVYQLKQTKAIKVFTWLTKYKMIHMQLLLLKLTKFKYRNVKK